MTSGQQLVSPLAATFDVFAITMPPQYKPMLMAAASMYAAWYRMALYAQDELGQGREGWHHSTVRQAAACSHAAELRRELREWKRGVDAQLVSILGEMAVVKNCIMQLYNVLLPGKFPMAQPSAALPQQPPQHVAVPPHHPPAYRQVGTHSAWFPKGGVLNFPPGYLPRDRDLVRVVLPLTSSHCRVSTR